MSFHDGVQRFGSALGRLGLLLDLDRRRPFCRYLDGYFPGEFSAEEGAWALGHHVAQFCCTSPARLRAVGRLVDNLAPLEDGLTEVHRVRAVLADHLDDEHAGESAVRALRALLTGIGFDEIRPAYRAATRDRREPRSDRHLLHTAWDAFLDVGDMLDDDGAPPRRIVLAEEIALQRCEIAARLRSWVDALPESRAFAAEIARLRARPGRGAAGDAPEPDGTAWLIVRAEPLDGADPGDPPDYQVSHWLRHPADGGEATVSGGSVRVPHADFTRHVAELARREEAELWHRCECNHLGIELILPYSLLPVPLPAARPHSASVPRLAPLGAGHEIVVRNWDRLYDPDYRPSLIRLRGRWEELHRGRATTHWSDDASGAPLPDRLAGDDAIAVCVLGTRPDLPEGDEQLRTALMYGVPVVLWCTGDMDDRLRSFITEIAGNSGEPVNRPGIISLPARLRRLRSGGSDSFLSGGGREYDHSLSYLICLIYDDLAALSDLNSQNSPYSLSLTGRRARRTR